MHSNDNNNDDDDCLDIWIWNRMLMSPRDFSYHPREIVTYFLQTLRAKGMTKSADAKKLTQVTLSSKEADIFLSSTLH